jgi:hypothetical protein
MNKIEPYIQVVRRRSTRDIAWNDCPTIVRILIRGRVAWLCPVMV